MGGRIIGTRKGVSWRPTSVGGVLCDRWLMLVQLAEYILPNDEVSLTMLPKIQNIADY